MVAESARIRESELKQQLDKKEHEAVKKGRDEAPDKIAVEDAHLCF